MKSSFLIAAHDTDRVSYPDEAVDFRCSGENDGAQINAFMAAHYGGAFDLAPGTYWISEEHAMTVVEPRLPAEGEQT